jgi:hypothetical protein
MTRLDGKKPWLVWVFGLVFVLFVLLNISLRYVFNINIW